jgi:DNA-directed RNA polymerase specialized sigma subunit
MNTKEEDPENVDTLEVVEDHAAHKKNTKNMYITKAELLKEVVISKQKGKMSNELARMLMLLTSKYAKSSNFARYTFNEDMQAFALMMLVRTWNSFDPTKSENPFAFFTQCIKNSFIQFLNTEKRQRNIRDELLVDQGLTPSYTYLAEHSDNNQERIFAYDEQDHEQYVKDFNELNSTPELDEEEFGNSEETPEDGTEADQEEKVNEI